MLHLRLIVPSARTAEAVEVLEGCPGVTNLVVLSGAAREPVGDVILCDAARESANEVLGKLKWLEEEGSIAVEQVDLSLSKVAEAAIEEAPGDPDDAVVWEDLGQKVQSESRVTWAYLAFLAIATQLAGIGVLQNSPILIVGAMVLGPEFGAVTAICFGLLQRRWHLVVTALRTLVIGFLLAIAITYACALVSYWLGWIDIGNLTSNKEVQFIVKPDRWSFIVALLAGAAGVLSITAGKSSALVGVFISVTTVPAAGYVAVAMAVSDWKEVPPSVSQLGINILGMVISGTVTLTVQRKFWPQVGRRSSV
ncbi:DUF389 domain-containing protein [Nonomuraea gerenzanensis]|uniref:Putative integral membrane protein n=1 Tax=Nonomuraea gerenzanensis TaxID=93944 RepID=A0A1M4DZU5_9ACTN|nr:DUF389 domain-containing protein [Nonomuraea gerenzanensis]UBU14375.1 DUF389 domain-containing protein [Nonomuraea gerenzanensis]SBO92082.1 putative integral membrane protein [Nonomuraea gerenzanensis]